MAMSKATLGRCGFPTSAHDTDIELFCECELSHVNVLLDGLFPVQVLCLFLIIEENAQC